MSADKIKVVSVALKLIAGLMLIPVYAPAAIALTLAELIGIVEEIKTKD